MSARALRVAALLALVALAACAMRKEPPPRPFVGTRWNVVLEIPARGEAPWVRFGDGRVEGYGGCNRFAARYVEDAVGARFIGIGRIEVGRHAACDPGAQMAESRILEVLQRASSYSVTGDVLTMSGSAGTLRLRAAGEEEKR